MISFINPGLLDYVARSRVKREREYAEFLARKKAATPCPVAKTAVAEQGVGE